MSGYTKVTVGGNLVKDVSFKQSNQGDKNLMKFTFANNRQIKTSKGNNKKTSFFSVEMWVTKRQEEYFSKNLLKGQGVIVIGSPKTKVFTPNGSQEKVRQPVIEATEIVLTGIGIDANTATLIGRATAAPELKHLPSGVATAKFSLVTSYKKADGTEIPEYHQVVAWGKLAESISQQIVKGKNLYIEGVIEMNEWGDDNHKKRAFVITPEKLRYTDKKDREEHSTDQNSEQDNSSFDLDSGFTMDDIDGDPEGR